MEGVSNYYFTQGVLGVSVFILGCVVVYMQRKQDKKDVEHAAEVKALNALLIMAALLIVIVLLPSVKSKREEAFVEAARHASRV